MLDNYNSFQGFLEVASLDPSGKICKKVFIQNIITYKATNILARSLGGDETYNPTHIWVGGTTSAPALPAVSRSDTTLSTSSDPDVSVNNVRSELNISSRAYSSSATTGAPSGQQNNNVVTFSAVMPAIPSDTTLNNKYFFEAGIITKIGTENILFAHQSHTAIQKLQGFQLVYTWSIRFI